MSDVKEAKQKRDEKLRLTRRRQSLKLLVAFLAVAILLTGGYLVVNSDVWLIQTISVVGNDHIGAKEVVAQSGIDNRTSLLRLPRAQIESRLKKNPWISTVSLTRNLPNSLIIDVTERRPFVGVRQGERLFVLDSSGFVIETKNETAAVTLPVIGDIRLARLRVGAQSKSATLKGTLGSLKKLAPDLRAKIIWISVPSLDKLSFHTAENLEIIFGPAAQAEKKNFIIKKILAGSTSKIIHINVTAPDHPVVRKIKP